MEDIKEKVYRELFEKVLSMEAVEEAKKDLCKVEKNEIIIEWSNNNE